VVLESRHHRDREEESVPYSSVVSAPTPDCFGLFGIKPSKWDLVRWKGAFISQSP